MGNEQVAKAAILPWYWNEHFPILPHVRTRKADEWNAYSFYFRWLVFRFWNNVAPQFGFDFRLELHGLHVTLSLPYCHLGLGFPIMPWKLASKLQGKTWRTGTRKF